ncbi:hypothetical protein [Sedimentibacter sp.]|uniref:hypothetical protein n=1 Tax=Sedimentibacter sp. TaxID=1960295 RepID=UPI000ECB44C7|nr:hypothetical protein [Sedimentibacter sp.]HCX62056.1 hypothetical protein [Clostridiales bacterium]
MKEKVNLILLRMYDLLLSLTFIIIGVLMISSRYGIFAEEFPKEFLSVLPFDSWFIPGIISIIVFGIGNIIAFIFSFLKKDNPHSLSLIMGSILFICMVLQVIILREWYLATVQFIVLSIVQIALSTETLWTI